MEHLWFGEEGACQCPQPTQHKDWLGGRANWPVNVILTIGRQVVIDNQGHLLHINATSLQSNTKSLMQSQGLFSNSIISGFCQPHH